jgi:hypothetical protein
MDRRLKLGKSPLVLLLVTAQCDEEFVVRCLCQMRQQNINVWLVGLYPGPVAGINGVWLRPDENLADVDAVLQGQAPRLLILPGPDHCTLQLLLNPRVSELIEMTLQDGGCVAASSAKTEEILRRSGLVLAERDPCFLFQDHRPLATFIDQLLTQTASWQEQVY